MIKRIPNLFLLPIILGLSWMFIACNDKDASTTSDPALPSETVASNPAKEPIDDEATWSLDPTIESESSPTTFQDVPVTAENAIPETQKMAEVPRLKGQKRNLSWCPEMAVPTQRYTLASDESHIFRGNEGTLIQVPEGAFVDKKTGKPVTGEVTLLLREAYKKSDLLKSGFPTRAGRKMLRSGGVIEMTAEVDGRACEIAPDKTLYVEFVSPDAYGDMCLWSGAQDAEGYLNWEEVGKAHKDMVLFPLELLDLAQIARTEQEKSMDSIRRSEKVRRITFQDQFETKLQDPNTQSSWLATREFRDRLEAIRQLGEGYEFADHYVKDQHGRLVEKDKKVLMELIKIRQTHEQGNGSGHLTALIEQYEKFVGQDKGEVEIIPDLGIDLSAEDAQEQLIAKGIEPQTADRWIAVHARQQFLQAEFEKTLALEEAEMEKHKAQAISETAFSGLVRPESRGFSVSRLGLFNCDAVDVLRQPQEVSLNLQHESAKVWQYARCYLAIHKTNSVWELPHRGQGRFSDDALPNNRRSTLVALSYVKGQHYLAMAQFKIGNEAPDLSLRPVSMEELESALKELDERI